MNLRGRHVTIMGLGHFGGGVSAARWAARQGALVTVTDLADRHVLAGSLDQLADEPIARFHLDGHREEDFRRADLVVVNPAVRPGNRLLKIAADSGARLTSEIEMFLERCPAPVIGVTGSDGKSTTAAMIGAILQADGHRTHLGGNIGQSLLERLDQIGRNHWVVLELSSFQLWHLAPDVRMPRVAVVTNCRPNHLDWHGTYPHYVAAKQRILAGGRPEDLAVLGSDDAELNSWRHLVRGHRLTLVDEAGIPSLSVPGRHNRANAVCAATAAAGIGCSGESIRRGLETFAALLGRLERVREVSGRRFYNDSSSTTPEATVAALESLEGPIWLMAGGSDKGIDFEPLARAVVQRACGAAFYGAVRRVLDRVCVAQSPDFPSTTTETMAEALSWCWDRSRPGDNILLSPGCASHDQFQNFRRRGEHFVCLTRELAKPGDR